MDINKILESLGVDKLDESKQTEVKEKFDTLVETKVDEKVKEKEKEMKEELTEQYENKFEEYKKEITEKFSNFLDEVLDEEMEIPEKIKEYARKGELYEDVIQTLKTRMAIDEGMIDDETKGLLKESKDELSKQKDQINKLTSENMEFKKDNKELAASLYLEQKCDGLTLKQKERVTSILEGVTDKEEIDKKFDVIVESTNEDGTVADSETGSGELNENNTGKGNTDSQETVTETDNDPFTRMKSFWANQLINEAK